jgi:lactate dehydrogenase-like 2-hydroxyacid dehydrogenase
MKATAFLINTARGKIVDEEALATALREKRLAGAGLDVFEGEPQIHPALLEMNNVLLAPHVASATAEARMRMAVLAADNLLTTLAGERPPNLLNPEALNRRPV